MTLQMPPNRMSNPDKVDDLPPHLYRLPGTDWAIWRSVCLRAAGFPLADVLTLASSDCAEAADMLISAPEAVEVAQREALDALWSARRQADEARGRQLGKAIQRLRKGRGPDPALYRRDAVTEIAMFNRAAERLDQVRARFHEAYAQAVRDASHRLRQVASDNRFREAVTWQNRRAVWTGLDALRRKAVTSATRGSQQRQHEELVASYLQRYCTKNDTIGFFGPVGWAAVVDTGERIQVTPGDRLVASREAYFEVWGIDAVAAVIAQDERIKKWVAPRRRHDVYLHGRELQLPSGQMVEMSRASARLLDLCNGEKNAKQIATEMIAEGRYEDEAAVYQMLAELEQQEWVTWRLEVPLELRPEETLRRVLMSIEEDDLRRGGLAKLDKLEQARQAVTAAKNAATLAEAIQGVEATFSEITGRNATRSEGETYAARTILYEDCRRDLEVEMGPDIIAELGKPLSLLLRSARWYTYELAQTLRQRLGVVYREMVRQSANREVALTFFWDQVQQVLYDSKKNPLHQVAEGFQQRWKAILAIDDTPSQVRYTSEQLDTAVQEAFDAPAPGWRYARYHSPDVMIAAKDVAAIQRGEYDLIVGEFHMGVNTLNTAVLVTQSPCPTALLANLESDFPQPRLVPIVPKNDAAGVTGRFLRVLVSPKDYRLALETGPSTVPRSQVIPIGHLIVVEKFGQLWLQTRDGAFETEIVEGIADLLTTGVINQFKILPAGPHVPRVQIDKLVVQRESWVCGVQELTFAHEKEGAERYLGARQWQKRMGVPRQVFVKTGVETKPVYVDFDSPIYVDLLSKLIRAVREKQGDGGKVTISEMLPGPDATWLPDKDGQCYTGEFRMIAVDLKV